MKRISNRFSVFHNRCLGCRAVPLSGAAGTRRQPPRSKAVHRWSATVKTPGRNAPASPIPLEKRCAPGQERLAVARRHHILPRRSRGRMPNSHVQKLSPTPRVRSPWSGGCSRSRRGQRRRYALAFGLMLVAAGATALGAYLIGPVINGLRPGTFPPSPRSRVAAVIFMIKAMAAYGGRSARAHRQPHRRRQSAQDVRAPAAAKCRFLRRSPQLQVHRAAHRRGRSATQALNLLITSIGRDLFTLIGLVAVMAGRTR